MQTATIINEWVTWANDARKLRASTVHTYVEVLKALDAHVSPKSFAEVTLTDMESFLRRPRGRGCTEASAATLGKDITVMRSVWDWMHARGMIQANPSRLLVAPRLHNEKPKPISDDDWRTLWASSLTDEERVAMGLSFFCGMRRADVCRLRVANFRFTPEPHIHQAELKGGKRMDVPWGRLVSLYAERRPDLLPTPQVFTRALLRLLQRPQEAPLLGRWGLTDFVSPEAYGRHMQKAAIRAGITAHLHQLRHAHATNLLAMGISLERTSRLMGHSNIQTTMRYISTGVNPLVGIQEVSVDVEMPAYVGEVVKVDRWGR